MLGLCLSLLAFTMADPGETEDIPLQAIGNKSEEPPPPPPSKQPLGIVLGPKLGGQFGIAGPMGGSVLAGMEIGYRLPVLRRIPGLSMELTFANPGARRSSLLGPEHTSSLWLSIPIYATATFDLGPGLLRLLAGPAFEWWLTRATVSGSGFAFDDNAWSLGASGIVSYGILLGPGALALELRYRFGLPTIAGQPESAHTLGICAAYVLLL